MIAYQYLAGILCNGSYNGEFRVLRKVSVFYI